MKMKFTDLGENDKYVRLEDLLKFLQKDKDFYEKHNLIPCSQGTVAYIDKLIENLKEEL